jgi:hypothetical protein
MMIIAASMTVMAEYAAGLPLLNVLLHFKCIRSTLALLGVLRSCAEHAPALHHRCKHNGDG